MDETEGLPSNQNTPTTYNTNGRPNNQNSPTTHKRPADHQNTHTTEAKKIMKSSTFLDGVTVKF